VKPSICHIDTFALEGKDLEMRMKKRGIVKVSSLVSIYSGAMKPHSVWNPQKLYRFCSTWMKGLKRQRILWWIYWKKKLHLCEKSIWLFVLWNTKPRS
jgi:hypothetical protein